MQRKQVSKYGVAVIAPLDEVAGAVLVRWGFTVSGSEIIPSLAVELLCSFTLTP